jgi:ABC-type uncharacterized transport system substrate-binding protein
VYCVKKHAKVLLWRKVARRILTGEKPADIPVAIPQATRAMVNAARAAQSGIEITEETLAEIELAD